MSESSRPRVTVTLGGAGGRVVKRVGPDFSDQCAVSAMATGSKGSALDRLGTPLDDSYMMNGNKRQRGATHQASFGVNNSNDTGVGQHDLRFRLMQKNASRQTQNVSLQGITDLREKLSSRTATAVQPALHVNMMHPAVATLAARQMQIMAEPRDTGILGQHPSVPTVSDIPMIIPARSTYSPWTLDNLRRRSPDPVLRPSSTFLSPPRNLDQVQRKPTIRPADDEAYVRGNARRSSARSPSRNLDQVQRKPTIRPADDVAYGRSDIRRSEARSPVRNVDQMQRKPIVRPADDVTYGRSDVRRSEARSPLRNVEQMQRKPIVRPADDLAYVRTDARRRDSRSPLRNVDQMQRKQTIRPADDLAYVRTDARRRDTMSPPRPTSTVPYVSRTSVPLKPVAAAHSRQLPSSSGSLPKASYMSDEHYSIERLLRTMGLEKYSIIFKHEEVDMHALRQMGDIDLKELGIPMGPRRKILQALAPRSRRPP